MSDDEEANQLIEINEASRLDNIDDIVKEITPTSDVEESLSSRESIRRQLAAGPQNGDPDDKDPDDPGLSGNNLLLCFLNETSSDLEDETEDDEAEVPRIRASHPLACLGNDDNGGWDSDDSSSDNSLRSANNLDASRSRESLERVNTRVLVKGNISRKKGHVIIPLRCASEANHEDALQPETPQNSDGSSHSRLENAFFEQLAAIQADARRQLLEAKNMAVRTVENERQIRDDIVKLLLATPESQRSIDGRCGGQSDYRNPHVRKLNRRILTPMNVGQLQVILNYLMSQIETLNENLVQYLIAKDELAIEQDSLLTDIEDITKCIQGHDMSPF